MKKQTISPEQKKLARAIARSVGGRPAYTRRIEGTILNMLGLFGGTIASVSEASR